jgi:hypothetical protein
MSKACDSSFSSSQCGVQLLSQTKTCYFEARAVFDMIFSLQDIRIGVTMRSSSIYRVVDASLFQCCLDEMA